MYKNYDITLIINLYNCICMESNSTLFGRTVNLNYTGYKLTDLKLWALSSLSWKIMLDNPIFLTTFIDEWFICKFIYLFLS
jgi:hypothetical protein